MSRILREMSIAECDTKRNREKKRVSHILAKQFDEEERIRRKNRNVDDQECVRLNQLVDIAYHLTQWIFFESKKTEKNTDTQLIQCFSFYPNCNQIETKLFQKQFNYLVCALHVIV